MAQRLVIPSRDEVDAELSVTHPWWQFAARFNVAVTQRLPVARMHAKESEGVMMRWGLAHATARGVVNFTDCGLVRRGGLQSTHDLRRMWTYGQRGIVPLAGFYVWRRAAAGYDQPYYVRLVNRPVFGVAALWERAEAGEEVIESCALLTVEANTLLVAIDSRMQHMPAILETADYRAWLTGGAMQAGELLRPYAPTRMLCHPVAPYVNHLEFDEPRLIRPADR